MRVNITYLSLSLVCLLGFPDREDLMFLVSDTKNGRRKIGWTLGEVVRFSKVRRN